MERDGDESLLRAVVQVALDASALGVPGRHDPGARLLQLTRYVVQVGDVADDRDDFVLGGGRDPNLEVALLAEMGAKPVLDGREPAGLERRADARHQLLGDSGGSMSPTVEPMTMSGGFARRETSPATSR